MQEMGVFFRTYGGALILLFIICFIIGLIMALLAGLSNRPAREHGYVSRRARGMETDYDRAIEESVKRNTDWEDVMEDVTEHHSSRRYSSKSVHD